MAWILAVDDNETMRDGMVTIIRKMGHQVRGASSGAQALEMFDDNPPDIVLTDLKMEGMDGIELLEKIRKKSAETIVVIITAYGTIETAVEAIKKGAFDFITKPFSQDVLRMKVEQALAFRDLSERNVRLEQENIMLREDANRELGMSEMVGASPVMDEIQEMIRKVAAGDSTVYIHGESGTGKELIARGIHYQSHRADGPFVKVTCSALAEGILESELFGHEKGSFTGAIKQKLGRFELADKGTIFLDEIGDISPTIQLKLLRVLQEREFERVGGTKTIRVDAPVICATNRDLLALIREGKFREDLYYRLHIVPIDVPPLRERKSDIVLLVEHFLKKLSVRTRKEFGGVSDEAMKVLLEYPWPGNIRELENVIEQTMVLAEGNVIGRDDLPSFLLRGGEIPMAKTLLGSKPLSEILDDLERELIKEAFNKANKVKTETAKLLGIKTSALYYKLEKYGLI
jgi:two-component system, NtrC family, response regulator HydG